MKLHVLRVSAVSLLVVALGCGAAYGLTWDFGAKAGVHDSKLLGDPVTRAISGDTYQLGGTVGDYKAGFVGGAYATANFSDFFGIRADLQYVQAGGKGTVSGVAIIEEPNSIPQEATFDGTLTLSLEYIEVPVLAVFSFPANQSGSLELRGYIGPTFGWNTAAHLRLEGQAGMEVGTVHTQSVDQTADVFSSIKTFNFGGLMGFTVAIALAKCNIVLDTQWGRGFTTIDNTSNNRNTYTSAFSFQAGVEFPLGR